MQCFHYRFSASATTQFLLESRIGMSSLIAAHHNYIQAQWHCKKIEFSSIERQKPSQ
jgi:hypothetical protein